MTAVDFVITFIAFKLENPMAITRIFVSIEDLVEIDLKFEWVCF